MKHHFFSDIKEITSIWVILRLVPEVSKMNRESCFSLCTYESKEAAQEVGQWDILGCGDVDSTKTLNTLEKSSTFSIWETHSSMRKIRKLENMIPRLPVTLVLHLLGTFLAISITIITIIQMFYFFEISSRHQILGLSFK